MVRKLMYLICLVSKIFGGGERVGERVVLLQVDGVVKYIDLHECILEPSKQGTFRC